MDGLSELNPAQYTELFISEAQDHLQEMSQALLAVEAARRSGRLEVEAEQVAGLFRAAHTLKGMAAALGFQQIARLAHRMEDVLDQWRQKRSLTPALADALFACLDRLSSLVEAVSAAGHETGEIERELALLDRLLNAAPDIPDRLPQPGAGALPAAPPAWELQVRIAPDCQLKGPRAFVVLRRLAAIAALLGSRPPEAELRQGNYAEDFSLFFGEGADLQALRRSAGRVAEVVAVSVAAANLQASPAGGLPDIPAADPARPPVVELAEPPLLRPGLEELRAAMPPLPAETGLPKAGSPPGEAEPAAAIVRLKVSLLDQLLEAAAELVVNHSLLMQISRKHDLPDLKDGLETHAAAVKRLEQVVLSMRMVPASQVFNRFPRLIRDLANQLGKDVRFEMEGGEIELDRMILDRLTDPLVHLLRNAVDHGIELPDERRQAGKPLPAQIRLAARREQSKVLIEVADDGRGLSPDKILQEAIERGILTHRQAASLDSQMILDLICLPGFSTSTQITGISGRGVGMDVVKQTLNEMGGALEIDSQPGQGSQFRLTCPLTMAILPAILVRSGTEHYALPITHVLHTLAPQIADIRWLYTQPVLPWGDTLLPLFALGVFLGAPGASAIPHIPEPARLKTDGLEVESGFLAEAGKPAAEALPAEAQPDGPSIQVVVVARGRQAYGLVVDEILGKEDIVLKPLTRFLGSAAGLSGVTLRGEGEIVLVLDVAGLVQALAASGKGGVDG